MARLISKMKKGHVIAASMALALALLFGVPTVIGYLEEKKEHDELERRWARKEERRRGGMKSLRVGMTREEVVNLLGKPDLQDEEAGTDEYGLSCEPVTERMVCGCRKLEVECLIVTYQNEAVAGIEEKKSTIIAYPARSGPLIYFLRGSRLDRLMRPDGLIELPLEEDGVKE
jgi:hypothetical protein